MIRAIRTKLKQREIADLTGVSQPTVSNWLNMNCRPTGLGRKALQEHCPALLEEIDKAWAQMKAE